jgi:transposase
MALPGLRQPAHPAVPRPSKASLTAGPRSAHVERTFAWLSRSRRLARDYERLPETGETMIHAAMSRIMLRRIAA